MTPEEKRAYNKRYYAEHPELKIASAARVADKYKNDLEHRAKKIEYQKQHNAKNADKVRDYQREYKRKNRAKLNVDAARRKRIRYATDPAFRAHRKAVGRELSQTPEFKAYMRAYGARRRAENPEMKIADNLDRSIRSAIKKGGGTKSGCLEEFIGCTVQEFMDHIQKQFKPGMNWKNRVSQL